MSDDLDRRRRRALYRAGHRGTKEMDWLLGRFAAARLGGMGEAELAAFERLLAIADPELQKWIVDSPPPRGEGSGVGGLPIAVGSPPPCPSPTSGEGTKPADLSDLVGQLRCFHGLAAGGAPAEGGH